MRSVGKLIKRRFWLGLLGLGVSVAVAGCGDGTTGPLQVKVVGQVDFEGEPVADGRIIFRKADGDGRAFSGTISNGAYEVMAEPGRMSVVITASRPIPGKFDNSNGTPEPVGEMYIPPQYNDATSLTAEVASSGKNEFPFHLTARK